MIETMAPPPKMTRCQQASQELSCVLDNLFKEFSQKFSKFPDLVFNTQEINSFCKEVLRECPRFEWNDTPACGLRSCVNKWRQLLAYSIGTKVNNEKDVKDLSAIIKLLKSVIPCVRGYLSETVEEQMTVSDHNTKRVLEIMRNMSTDPEVIQILFNNVAMRFDHKLFGNLVINIFMIFTATIVSDGIGQSALSILSQKRRMKVVKEFYRTANYDKMIDMVSRAKSIWYTRVYPFLAYGMTSSMKRVIRVPRVNNWSLEVDTAKRMIDIVYKEVINRRLTKRNSSTIGCYVTRVKGSSKHQANSLGKVLIYVHGGGFVTNDMRSTNNFLPAFAARMPGLTVISIDISLAQCSMGKYPTPINEVLDVIYWLQSGDESVKSLLKLPDHPREYMISGDSSGAFIMTQTMAVLAEVNRRIRQTNSLKGNDISNGKHFDSINNLKEIQLPSKIIGLSPLFTLIPTFPPSMAGAVKDLLLFPTLLWHMGLSYLPELCDKDGNVVTSISQWNEKESFFLTPVEESLPNIQKYYWILDHPLFNPMRYGHWGDLKNTTLYVLSSDEDPLLDLALPFLPKWEGPVFLDVVPVLKHGFFYVHSVAKVTLFPWKKRLQEAEDILIERMCEKMDGDDDDESNYYSISSNNSVDVNHNIQEKGNKAKQQMNGHENHSFVVQES